MANGEIRQVAKKLSHSNRFRKLVLFLLVIVTLLGVVIYPVEKMAEGSNIASEWDGLWFAVTTVTGVGYGDTYPVSLLGRLIAMVLEIGGVVLFGSVVAYVSVEILRYQEDFNVRRILSRQDELHMKMDELKKHLDYLVRK